MYDTSYIKGTQWRDMFITITSYLHVLWLAGMAARFHSFRVLGECIETTSGVLVLS
jgi:hypothetical protein